MIEKEFISIDSYSGDQKLFRYIEIEKLIFMLSKNALPLFRMTLFNDPFEGSWPKQFLEIEEQVIKHFLGDMRPKDYRQNKKEYLDKSNERESNWRRNFFLSCWHASNFESEAMWRLYSSYNKGIAIQTDLNTLINEIPNEYDNKGFKSKITMGEVKYIDFNNPDMTLYKPHITVTRLQMFKRKAFEFEKEVRIITMLSSGYGNKDIGVEPDVKDDYILLDANLKNIIKRIIIAPDSPGWYAELISSILKKYELHFEVVNSTLKGEPLHIFWADIGLIDRE